MKQFIKNAVDRLLVERIAQRTAQQLSPLMEGDSRSLLELRFLGA
jgi:hypothetical protein